MFLLLVFQIVAIFNLIGAQQQNPNIVFILVDDWGWANAGYHREASNEEVVTPNIDNLVEEGLELNHHYVYNVCSPTRCSAMTGRYPIHVYDMNDNPFHYNPNDPISGFSQIPRNMTLIAEKLRDAGYAPHVVGKWDVGMATWDHTPLGRGFESFIGFFHHDNDYWNEYVDFCEHTKIIDFWEDDAPARHLNGTGYEEGIFKNRILQIVNKHDENKPLFLYYAPHLLHTPLQIPRSYYDMFSNIDDEERRLYQAMVYYLDETIGELVDALKARGMWDNTLFVLSSDNGGPLYTGGGANNFPLRGGKGSDWQGGVRVNAFVSGGYLPQERRGQKTDGYMHVADWYGTFCAIAGVDPFDVKACKANLPPVDSINMWPFISGEVNSSPRTEIPLSNNALIRGKYKILTGMTIMSDWTGPQYPNKTATNGNGLWAIHNCGRTGCLYNIEDDPYEEMDLAEQNPIILASMLSKLQEYQATRFNPDRGPISPLACDAALNVYGGFFGPFAP